MTQFVTTSVLRAAVPDFGGDLIYRINRLRLDREMTMVAFARKAGLAPETIRGAIHQAGLSVPATGTIASICIGHGVSANWLLFGDGATKKDEALACPVCVPRLGAAA